MVKPAVLLLLALSFFMLVSANTYYVSTAGNNSNSCSSAQAVSSAKKTINSALGCASAGDTVLVKSGTYYEQANVSKSGTATKYITLKAASAGVIIDAQNKRANCILVKSGKNYVSIEGFRCNNAVPAHSDAKEGGITINNGIGIILKNNIITNSRRGINVYDSGNNLLIENNTIDNKLIKNSYGIYGGTLKNSVVRGNTVSNFTRYGIGSDSKAQNVTVEKNLLASSADTVYAGITFQFTGSKNLRIKRNILEVPQFAGIIVRQASAVEISGNTLYFEEKSVFGANGAIVAYDISNSNIVNNIIHNSAYAIYATSFGSYEGYLTNVTIDYNLLDCIAVNEPDGTDDCISEASPFITAKNNQIKKNPNFVNALIGNVHLLSNSPAINAGNPKTLSGTDFYGTAVPQGGKADMGAVEFVATPTPSPSPTPSSSPTPSPSPTETPSPSPSPSPTDTPSPSPSPTETPSPSPSGSPTPTDTPSPSPTETPSPTASPSPTDTATPTPTATITPTPTPSATPSPTPTPDCALTTIRCVGAGQEYSAIQSAVDAAQPGDTVLVYPGTYFDYTEFDFYGTYSSFAKIENLHGTSTQPITIKSNGDVLLDGQGNVNSCFFIYQSSYIIVDGFKCTEVEPHKNASSIVHRSAVKIWDSDHVTFQNNKIYGINDTGIGLEWEGDTDTIVRNNTLTYADGMAKVGIAGEGIIDALIEGNTLINSEMWFSNGAKNVRIRGNYVTTPSTAFTGITVRDVTNFTVEYNYLYKTGPYGIMLRDDVHEGETDETQFEKHTVNNNIFDNSGYKAAIFMTNQNDDSITNNILINEFSLFTPGWTACQENKNIVIDYNLFYAYSNTWERCDGECCTDLNYSAFFKAHNLDGTDPLLNNIGGKPDPYFRLLSGSPAIDAGDPNTQGGTDFSGALTPQGAGFDIGAFEYVGFTPTPTPTVSPTPSPSATPSPTETPTPTPSPAESLSVSLSPSAACEGSYISVSGTAMNGSSTISNATISFSGVGISASVQTDSSGNFNKAVIPTSSGTLTAKLQDTNASANATFSFFSSTTCNPGFVAYSPYALSATQSAYDSSNPASVKPTAISQSVEQVQDVDLSSSTSLESSFYDTSTDFSLKYTSDSGFDGSISYVLPFDYRDYEAGALILSPEPASVTEKGDGKIIAEWDGVSISSSEPFSVSISYARPLSQSIIQEFSSPLKKASATKPELSATSEASASPQSSANLFDDVLTYGIIALAIIALALLFFRKP